MIKGVIGLYGNKTVHYDLFVTRQKRPFLKWNGL